jgi:hypothetical protein
MQTVQMLKIDFDPRERLIEYSDPSLFHNMYFFQFALIYKHIFPSGVLNFNCHPWAVLMWSHRDGGLKPNANVLLQKELIIRWSDGALSFICLTTWPSK